MKVDCFELKLQEFKEHYSYTLCFRNLESVSG